MRAQPESLSPEEKEMLNDLAKRHRVEVPDHYEEERKRLEEEQKKIIYHFTKEKTKLLDSKEMV